MKAYPTLLLPVFLLYYCFCCECLPQPPINTQNLQSPLLSKYSVKFQPVSIKIDNITQSYPVTFLNKLLSSVPKRDKAIDNVSISFGHLDQTIVNSKHNENGLTLLVGRSASGKSTLLRIIAQVEKPVSGQMYVNDHECFKEDQSHTRIAAPTTTASAAKPIIIDSKPDCYDTKTSVYQRIFNSIPEITINIENQIYSKENIKDLKETVIIEFAQNLGFTLDELHSSTPADLTPSQQFLFGLACTCMESCFASKLLFINEENKHIVIPCPVLLLDELLDKETSGVANKVGHGLLSLSQKGAIVIVATHRPQYLMNVAERVVTLSSGKILMTEYPNQ